MINEKYTTDKILIFDIDDTIAITPAKNEDIAQHVLAQVHQLFPSSRELKMTWFSVVKLAQSLYREAPGMDVYRPSQATPIANFFLAGSYTQQDYIDSMEGATLSGKQAAKAILQQAERWKSLATVWANSRQSPLLRRDCLLSHLNQ